jgi:hypothetical protein
VAYAFAGGGRREPSGLDVAADGGSSGDASNHNAFYSPVATHGYSASFIKFSRFFVLQILLASSKVDLLSPLEH